MHIGSNGLTLILIFIFVFFRILESRRVFLMCTSLRDNFHQFDYDNNDNIAVIHTTSPRCPRDGNSNETAK